MEPTTKPEPEHTWVKYEVRQWVQSVKRRWPEVVAFDEHERLARMTYERLARENPTAYFELVRVTSTEQCLSFTTMKVPTP